MVTGDKFEAAERIAKSANILSDSDIVLKLSEKLKGQRGVDELSVEVRDILSKYLEYSLVVDMSQFSFEDLFENDSIVFAFLNARGVVCARSSPKTKGRLAEVIKHDNRCVLGVGDGDNDVNMITKASVGVGIVGKEGTQAAYVSDFAIGEFQVLWKLLLFYGRVNYMRMSNYTLLFVFKNILFVFTQYIFGYFCLASGQTIFDSWYVNMINTLLTNFQHLYIGIFDIDVHYIQRIRRPRQQPIPIDKETKPISDEGRCPGEHRQKPSAEEFKTAEQSPSQQGHEDVHIHSKYYARSVIKDNYWILYHESQLNYYFSDKRFWSTFAHSLLVSTILFFVFYFSFNAADQSGHPTGFAEFGQSFYMFVVLSVNITFVKRSHSSDVLLYLLILVTSLGLMMLFMAVYNAIPGSLLYATLPNVMNNSVFYFVLAVSLAFYYQLEDVFVRSFQSATQKITESFAGIVGERMWQLRMQDLNNQV